MYQKENIPEDAIPSFQDNTPCCDLIGRTTKHFVGIFPILDDLSIAKSSKTAAQYCDMLLRKFGRAKGEFAKANNNDLKQSSKYFYGNKSGNTSFFVRHFAGDVKYFVKGWLKKNLDKLPPQLATLMQASSVPYVAHIHGVKKGGSKKGLSRGSGGRSKRGMRHGKNTIAFKFVSQLDVLAHTIKKTNPHYQRCVKPNDVHMRPIDG